MSPRRRAMSRKAVTTSGHARSTSGRRRSSCGGWSSSSPSAKVRTYVTLRAPDDGGVARYEAWPHADEEARHPRRHATAQVTREDAGHEDHVVRAMTATVDGSAPSVPVPQGATVQVANETLRRHDEACGEEDPLAPEAAAKLRPAGTRGGQWASVSQLLLATAQCVTSASSRRRDRALCRGMVVGQTAPWSQSRAIGSGATASLERRAAR